MKLTYCNYVNINKKPSSKRKILYFFNTRMGQKYVTGPIIQNNKLVEFENAIDTRIYNSWFQCLWSCDSRHMYRSTAVAVQHGDPLENLVSLGSLRSYVLFPAWKVSQSSQCWLILLHYSAQLHVAQQTQNWLQKFGLEMLDHPHTFWIWHHRFLSVSHIEGALVMTLFYLW